jgi:hypothetical protein
MLRSVLALALALALEIAEALTIALILALACNAFLHSSDSRRILSVFIDQRNYAALHIQNIPGRHLEYTEFGATVFQTHVFFRILKGRFSSSSIACSSYS